MNLLILKGFNNYFNRKVKKYTTLEDYNDNSEKAYYFTNINFNPNDGVTTAQVIGSENQQDAGVPLDWENSGAPDYLVCYETDSTTSTSSINSRWFVLECVRTRNGQYQLALKRDTVADFLNNILSSTCFIEKGMISSTRNPLLFNKESMTYNQIKINEQRLFDLSQVPWIVGYVASNVAENDKSPLINDNVVLSSTGTASGTYNVGHNNLEVNRIELWLDNEGMSWRATPYNLSIDEYTFQATYDPDSGSVIYRADVGPNWANYNCNIRVYYATGISVDSSVMHAPGEYIDSDELPWDFNPASSYLAGLTKYKIEHTIINNISNQTYYRYLWVNKTTNISSTGGQSTPSANILITLGNQTSWPSYDIRNVYPNYTSANSGSGAWGTYGNESKLKLAAANISIPSADILSDLSGVGVQADYSVPNAYLYNGAIVKHGSKFYRLEISPASNLSHTFDLASGTSYNHYLTSCQTFANNYNLRVASDSLKLNMNYHAPTLAGTLKYTAYYTAYNITAVEMNYWTDTSGYIPSDGVRAHLLDAPYDMFAIPYGAISVVDSSRPGFSSFTADKDVGMSIALEMVKDIGTAKVYDIQLLPYCPVRAFLDSENEIDLANGTLNTDYSWITETSRGTGTTTNKSVILWANKASGTFDINLQVNLPEDDTNEVLNTKINNECYLYRLVSPNYSGQFEFSLAKNNGLTKFNVDYTYRPYNPYIHVNPDFGGLYGQDWDDARGLICGGDFSLPIVSSAWTDYQVSNKNYQEIFDRQIANMDVNNQIALEQVNFQKITSAITGPIGGAAGGALTGAKLGGGYGAVAGAALGTAGGLALGLIGGQLDENWLLRQQAEAKDYAIDMYGYQLGNIQALPYSLTKTSAITYNNRLVPILETYSATDTEKQALKNKLIRDGMTVMVVDTVSNYYNPDLELSFLRGDIIELNVVEDFHVSDAIYQEIKKGVYFTQEMEI